MCVCVKDIDECAKEDLNNCDKEAADCTNTDSGHYCFCKRGYTEPVGYQGEPGVQCEGEEVCMYIYAFVCYLLPSECIFIVVLECTAFILQQQVVV